MRSPIEINKNVWTDEELEEIDKIVQQTMERIALQTGEYMPYDACSYAVKLAIIKRQFDDTVRKLASLTETEGDLLRGILDEKE